MLHPSSISKVEAPQQPQKSVFLDVLCFICSSGHATSIQKDLQGFISEVRKNKFLPSARSGTLAEANGKARLNVQSVLPDWIL